MRILNGDPSEILLGVSLKVPPGTLTQDAQNNFLEMHKRIHAKVIPRVSPEVAPGI